MHVAGLRGTPDTRTYVSFSAQIMVVVRLHACVCTNVLR